MTYFIKDFSVVVITENYKIEVSKNTFNKDILNEKILSELSFEDLQVIWKNLYGIPKNIKDLLKKKVELYKNSFKVKSFIYQDSEYWLDKNNRNSLLNLSNSSLGNIDLILGKESVSLAPLALKAFLIKLESYAHKCFVTLSKHLNAIDELKTVEEILNYDYTTGYPDKIVLE